MIALQTEQVRPILIDSRGMHTGHDESQPAALQRASTSRVNERQKQAMIDNLQLEVTERARKLRAQYALQAQSLRTRVELRINRVPTSLRCLTMLELRNKYALRETNGDKHEMISSTSASTLESQAVEAATIGRSRNNGTTEALRGKKRKSDALKVPKPEIVVHEDIALRDLPHKRAKAAGRPTVSRSAHTNTILSPKSGNSRGQQVSSQRTNAVGKDISTALRPTSPLKPPIASSRTQATAATAFVTHVDGEKKLKGKTVPVSKSKLASKVAMTTDDHAESLRSASSASHSSTMSSATTIVKSSARSKPITEKKASSSKAKEIPKRPVTVKDSPVKSRRILRTRV